MSDYKQPPEKEAQEWGEFSEAILNGKPLFDIIGHSADPINLLERYCYFLPYQVISDAVLTRIMTQISKLKPLPGWIERIDKVFNILYENRRYTTGAMAVQMVKQWKNDIIRANAEKLKAQSRAADIARLKRVRELVKARSSITPFLQTKSNPLNQSISHSVAVSQTVPPSLNAMSAGGSAAAAAAAAAADDGKMAVDDDLVSLGSRTIEAIESAKERAIARRAEAIKDRAIVRQAKAMDASENAVAIAINQTQTQKTPFNWKKKAIALMKEMAKQTMIRTHRRDAVENLNKRRSRSRFRGLGFRRSRSGFRSRFRRSKYPKYNRRYMKRRRYY